MNKNCAMNKLTLAYSQSLQTLVLAQVYSGLSTFVPANLSPWKAPSPGVHMPHFLASLRVLLNHPITHEAFQNQHLSARAHTPLPYLYLPVLSLWFCTSGNNHYHHCPAVDMLFIISFFSLECSFKNYHIPRTISLIYVLHSRCSIIQ